MLLANEKISLNVSDCEPKIIFARSSFDLQVFFHFSSTSFPLLTENRSSHQRYSIKKVLFKISQNPQETWHACARVFLNKDADMRPSTLLKKRLWHRCFPVNFANVLRAPFLQNISGRLASEKRPKKKLGVVTQIMFGSSHPKLPWKICFLDFK